MNFSSKSRLKQAKEVIYLQIFTESVATKPLLINSYKSSAVCRIAVACEQSKEWKNGSR